MHTSISKTIYNWIEAHVFRQVVFVTGQIWFKVTMLFWFNPGWFTISFVSSLETKENENQPKLQMKPEIKFDL